MKTGETSISERLTNEEDKGDLESNFIYAVEQKDHKTVIVILKNGSTAFNDGGGYNANNGRFTAPVDGIYQFNVNLSIQITNPNEGLLQMILDSPGAKYGESVILTTQDNSSGYGYYQMSIAQTVKLSANSQIWVTIFSSQNNGKIDMWSSSFSGHLVK